ncbi:oxidoreductase (homolog to thioredoxin-disulfide reductase) [Natronomonas pharaonis DSM 2160]|uniref:Oxidoreductase (Homolog to thioredoxin-disulfide reductase) n=1 Tax=Natronomonas pharaonis (strain ATCC 35678 / DSM 2160 / CIP 103997 / JCM 8858 / NBRC 14720 / NCIMB 2260 / Gabara) TaxID=348780 RepID=A0A1U7EUV1_NATPD|nr:FAD-dependent oxidoreductase [Natronomonas pharaonis]CAI48783.1 oxidoreductase (homolog to thioredoxin-disulfide reductase) [Natronomonas pharaonis DSM 2160]
MTAADTETGTDADPPRAAVIGGGVAGLTAATFLARAGLDTVVIDHGESILRRNAHLENVPGFPAGVNSRLFLDLLERQAERNGCLFEQGFVTAVEPGDDGFRLRIEADTEFDLAADYVIAASWADTAYLEPLEAVGLTERGSKTYVDTDDDGRTDLDGLYAAGRTAGAAHQTVVCAGDGADVALTLVHDSDVPFYHDWVAPDGYFTDRGREVPPGCEEIDEAERRRRERESMEVMAEAFAEAHPDEPTMHPSAADDE